MLDLPVWPTGLQNYNVYKLHIIVIIMNIDNDLGNMKYYGETSMPLQS